MLLLALCNVLLGAICGFWFRVSILAPLVAVAFIEEVVIPKHSPTWSSAFWSTLLLVATLEVGYLIGVSTTALRRSLARVRDLRDLLRYGNGGSQLFFSALVIGVAYSFLEKTFIRIILKSSNSDQFSI